MQIGDENVHLVRCVMDEVFGSENFVSLITVRKDERPAQRIYCSIVAITFFGMRKRQRTRESIVSSIHAKNDQAEGASRTTSLNCRWRTSVAMSRRRVNRAHTSRRRSTYSRLDQLDIASGCTRSTSLLTFQGKDSICQCKG